MEPNTTPNTDTQTPSAPMSPEPKKGGSLGGIIAILVILVLIVVGALYFWGERVSQSPSPTDTQVETLQEQGDSTDPNDIEADLDAQSPDEFEAELDAAMNELDASFDAE